jgi:hypothetical protein
MDEKQALTELRFVEQELSSVIGQVVGRVSDEDVRSGLQQVRDEHARQAGEVAEALTAIGQAEAQPPGRFREHVQALEREILHARDEDGLFDSLAVAERFDVQLHEHLRRETMPAQVHGVIEKQLAEDQEHLNFLENRAPGITPTIHGVGSVPKRGPVL